MEYKPYWKSEFQQTLSSLSYSSNLLDWEEVSGSIETGTLPINEFVYRFNLVNKSCSIIIFSSVDKSTERSRDVGADAVRIIYEWKTKNGLIYSRIAKRNRVDTLFENMSDSILQAASQCRNLTVLSWGTMTEALA